MKAFRLLVVFAFLLIPSTAQAEGLVTNSLGELASEIHATSENFEVSFGEPKLKCATLKSTQTVLVQTDETFHSEYTGTGIGKVGEKPHSKTCRVSPSDLEVHFVTVEGTIHITPAGGYKTKELDFILTHPILGPIYCLFKSKMNLSHPPGGDTYTVSGTYTSTENVPPCPGEGEMSGTFTVTDEFGGPATIH